MTVPRLVVRQNDESVVLKNVFQKARLITLLGDNFEPYSDDGHASGPGRGASIDLVNNSSLRGIICNCSNAIRLQVCHHYYDTYRFGYCDYF